MISLRRLPALKPAERNGVITTTEVEVPAAREATAMEMVTDMATGIATGTVTGMAMDVVTETAMAMVMDVATEVAMEMVTEMGMCLVVEVVEVAEAPQPVVGEVVEEEEEVVAAVGAEAALEEVAVAAVVVDMNFSSTSRIVPVLLRRLSFSGNVASTRSQYTILLYSFNAELCA